MRHHVAGRKLGREPSHRRAMLRNMVTSLILNDRIETTVTRAKEARRIAEKMVTLGKEGTLAARRAVKVDIANDAAVKKLFSVFAERYKDRNGGYTRIIRSDYRSGDSAPMAILEYVEAGTTVAEKTPAPKKKSTAKKAKSE